jgi:hypothetical protein
VARTEKELEKHPKEKSALEAEVYRALHPIFGGPEDIAERRVARQAAESQQPSRTASIYPTPEEINALPEKVRRYIHDLVTRCDKSRDVQTISLLHEDRDALAREVEELKAEIAKPKHPKRIM